MHTATPSPAEVFSTPPSDFSPSVEVAACYLRFGDEHLFLRRSQDSSQGGTWGVAAGKLEAGELPLEAVLRELMEETGLKLLASDLRDLGALYIRYPNTDFVYHMFAHEYSILPDVELSHEHEEYRWMKIDELLQLPLVGGARESLDHYLTCD